MSDKEKQNADRQTSDNKSPRPDPETLHTTDPQEHMKGPVSSTMQSIKKEANKDDKVSKEEADRKREENM